MGTRVEARFGGGAKRYPGVIVRAHAGGTFDIDYDDGDKESHVKCELIRAASDGSVGAEASAANSEQQQLGKRKAPSSDDDGNGSSSSGDGGGGDGDGEGLGVRTALYALSRAYPPR